MLLEVAKKWRPKFICWITALIFLGTLALVSIEFAYSLGLLAFSSMDFAYILIPLILGGTLAFLDLADSYDSIRNSLWRYTSVQLYLLVSSIGSVLLTQTLKLIGTKFVNNDILDMIYLSIVGAGIFVKILPSISVGKDISPEGQEHLLTIRDKIYGFLKKSIERTDITNRQNEIRKIIELLNVKNYIERTQFLRQFARILDDIPDMDDGTKAKIKEKAVSDIVNYDEYDTAIRHLMYYGTKFIKDQFRWCIKQDKEEL